MSDEMKQLIPPPVSEPQVKQVSVDLVKPSNQAVPRFCFPLIELSIIKYIASNSLPSIYRTFKSTKLEDLISGVNNDRVEIEEESIEFAGGFKKFQFGVRPRFDLHRTEKVKVQDLRDYGQLINGTGTDSPISTLLLNLKI